MALRRGRAKHMRNYGWGSAVVVMGLILAAAAVPANAGGYLLSIEGNGSLYPDGNGALPQWGVAPGATFQVDAVLTGDILGLTSHDAAIFDVSFTGPRNLTYNKYLWNPIAYNTGGADDYSIPEVDPITGLFPAGVKPIIDNDLYVPPGSNPPVRADVHFEAVTRPGQTFGSGTIVTLTLKMPADAQIGEKFLIEPFPDAFLLGFNTVPTDVGSSLGVIVVPEPTTLILLGLGGMAAIRRRLQGV